MTPASAIGRRLRATRATLGTRAFRLELQRTLAAWGALFCVGIWMVVCQQWSDTRWLRHVEHTQPAAPPWPPVLLLHDQLLDVLPPLRQAWVADRLVGSAAVISILGCATMARGWRQSMLVVRRIAWMVAALYLLRSLTLSATTLPPSSAQCSIPRSAKSTWQVIKATPQILAGSEGQCTDKVFSGHTAILLITFLFWHRYATHRALVAYAAVHCTAGIVAVLMARYHYSVDVLLALVLTYFVHQAYYCALERAVRRRLLGRWDEQYSLDVVRRRRGSDDDAMWSDQDSAVGASGRHTPETPFVVRKRETAESAAAIAAADTDDNHCAID
ncbi:hypothetical protein IW150_000627, partial [Coemansia sp. RSA 2607]